MVNLLENDKIQNVRLFLSETPNIYPMFRNQVWPLRSRNVSNGLFAGTPNSRLCGGPVQPGSAAVHGLLHRAQSSP